MVGKSSSGLLKQNSALLEGVQRALDIAVIALSLFVAAYFRDLQMDSKYALMAAIAIALFLLLASAKGIYRSWRTDSLGAEIFSINAVWLMTIALLVMIGFATKSSSDFSRVVVASWMVLVPLGLSALRLLYRETLHMLRLSGRNTRTVAFAGAGNTAQKLAHHINAQPWMGLSVMGVFDDRSIKRVSAGDLVLVGNLNDLVARAKEGRLDMVYVTLPMHAEHRILQLIDQLSDTTASVSVVPDIFVFDLFQAQWSSVAGMPVVSVYDSPFYGVDGSVKRIEDIVIGSMILMLISPLMLAIAIGIKLTSPGSVLFKQRRYGLNGAIVEVWKFRSMTVSDNGDKVVQASRHDARVTPFGAFLRRTSLDELPQFINVLQGHMSIVGPRPHAVAHNEEYRHLIHGYMLRHKVKPGITGWAQINGWRGETDTLEKNPNSTFDSVIMLP